VKRVAIIGGGISGLSAAYTLEERRQSGVPVEYVLFESSSRLGGVFITDHIDGCIIEAGPDSFLTEKPWAADLCRKIGLADQLIGSNDADRKTYIVVKNKLVVLPDGLMFMVPTKIMPTVLSSLFSVRTKLGMAAEWFHPPRRATEDETVAAMVERHYGSEMVDLLADPLLSGVYGGEAANLSVRAVLPRFVEMEAKHGSLGRAMLAARAARTGVRAEVRTKTAAATKSAAPPIFTSLKDGMQQLIDVLIAGLDPKAMRTSSSVRSVIAENGNGWTVHADQSAHFDAVIIATPTQPAAAMLQSANPNLARDLSDIKYSSSVTVTLGYDEKVRRSLPPGFGFLVPRREGRRMLAATFVHNKFPHRAPENRAVIRCFLGGSRDEQILQSGESEILQIVRDELRQVLGDALTAEPLFARVYKWRSAMAQYSVGHLERVRRIQSLRQKLPGLALAGNGYSGIGVPDCVRSGAEAASKVLAELGPG